MFYCAFLGLVLLEKNVFSVKRAQSSIETILILAMALFILAALVGMVYDQISLFKVEQDQKIASIAVMSIAKEVNDVYFTGPGTVKNIIVQMPEDIDFSKSSIEGRTLLLNVGGGDIFASTNIDVRGDWPSGAGLYSFSLNAFDDYVSISVVDVSASPSQISEQLNQGESKSFSVTLANNSAKDYFYSLSNEFPFAPSSGADLTSDLTGLLKVKTSDSNSVNFLINCESDSFGSYSGKLVFVPLDSSDSNITVPINLFCSSAQTKLISYPGSKIFNVKKNSVSFDSIFVCNATSRDFVSSKVSISGGVAPFVITSFSQGISKSSCKEIQFVINAPNLEESYVGYVLIESGGFRSLVELELNVGA